MALDPIANILQHRGQVEALQDEMHRLEDDIQVAKDHLTHAKEACPHPEEYLIDSLGYTSCKLCGKFDV